MLTSQALISAGNGPVQKVVSRFNSVENVLYLRLYLSSASTHVLASIIGAIIVCNLPEVV